MLKKSNGSLGKVIQIAASKYHFLNYVILKWPWGYIRTLMLSKLLVKYSTFTDFRIFPVKALPPPPFWAIVFRGWGGGSTFAEISNFIFSINKSFSEDFNGKMLCAHAQPNLVQSIVWNSERIETSDNLTIRCKKVLQNTTWCHFIFSEN